jgi:multidrug efflux pump subunit AcrA (membrane-fusion protein)
MRSKKIVPIVGVIILAVAGGVYFTQQATATNGDFTLSGTIEATETNLSTMAGGRVRQVYVGEGDQITRGESLVFIYSVTAKVSEDITSPLDGVVLQRLVEPDEIVAPGTTVLVVAPLNALSLKIYVPEDRYGQISLGQTYPVTVDSFPGETFYGKVSVISDKAEFTPRNVQTTDSRQTTVYAVKLDLEPAGGRLKPGMPADVHLALQSARSQ